MQWTDTGIVLSLRKHGETSGILRVLTREHGIHAGLVKGAFSRKKSGLFQLGNRLLVTWQGRLPEHLGFFSCELVAAHAAAFLHDPLRLAVLTSMTELLEATLPERHAEPVLYGHAEAILETPDTPEAARAFLTGYTLLERDLLHELGIGLDLSVCAMTGSIHQRNDPLAYVSPKSGQACVASAGGPYRDKLLPLPRHFVENGHTPPMGELLDALRLTGYFLEKWWFNPHGAPVPAARHRLLHQCSVAPLT